MENTKLVALIGDREIRFSILKEKLDAVRRLYPDAMWISNGTIGADLMIASMRCAIESLCLCASLFLLK